jgi:hypothetical protein
MPAFTKYQECWAGRRQRSRSRVRHEAVEVARDGDDAVSQQISDRIDVHPSLKSSHRGIVPQSVQADVLDALLAAASSTARSRLRGSTGRSNR